MFCSSIGAQQVFNGVVYEYGTNSVVPYAMIFAKGKDVGVVSDKNGKFSLVSDKIEALDSITITSLGYSKELIAVKDWKDGESIFIRTNPFQINEALVTANRTKNIKIGITGAGMKMLFVPLFMKQELDKNDFIGREVGVALKVNRDCHVKKLNFFIALNKYDNVKLRALFYEMKDGRPGDLIVNKDIIFNVDIEKGWYSVDLIPYDIYLSKGQQIAVTLMTLDETNRNEFFIYGRLLKNPGLFRRDRALGEWDISNGGMALYLDAQY
ncbi:hypothetical protein SDC9_109663 [bioreactor metagenome]|uniref:TonB-dependent receptor SusC n=1 Tax=bioreactor metagenome TaxID=1076179 RepID=A0A645BBF7_9ZZZZ